MKKIYNIVLVCALLLGYCGNAWGEEKTVANSTSATSKFIPIYGNYNDGTQRAQIIYPADMLSDIAGSNVTAMTFYISSAAAQVWNSTYNVSLAIVNDSKFTDIGEFGTKYAFNTTTLTTVYAAKTLDGTGATMTIAFDQAFYYTGGNLLFDLQTVTANSVWKDAYFYGQSQSDVQSIYYASYSSVPATTANGLSFIPKTTFTYESSTPVSCPKPTDLAYDHLTHNGVDLSWTAGGSETTWNVLYKAGSGAWTTISGVTSNPYHLALSPSTSYQVKVQADCGGGDVSAETSAISFTSPEYISCPKPTALAYDNLLATSVDLSWTVGGSETTWKVLYKAGSGDWTTISDVTTNSYHLALSPSTNYQVKVQADCGGDDISVASDPISFSTPCGAITSLPWLETFDGMTEYTVPNCWDNSGSDAYTKVLSNSVVWTVHDDMIWMKNYHADGGAAVINTPTFNLPDKKCELVFNYSNVSDNSAGLQIKVSEDGGSTFSAALATYSNGGSYSTSYTPVPGTWHTAKIDLTAYKNKNIIIQFYTEADYSYGAIFVDSVRVRAVTTCAKPGTPTVSHILNTTARLTWTHGTETQWNILYKKTADANWTTISNVTANPYTLTGLDYATEYQVKVQAVCGEDDESEYSGIATFTTPCVALGVPWIENFESTAEDALATCWNTNGSTAENQPIANTLHINSVWGTHEHSSNLMARMAAYYTSTGAPRVALLHTPQIILPSSYSCELTFDYANNMYFEYNDKSIPVSLQLNISTDGGVTWTELGSYAQSPNVALHKDDEPKPTILTDDPIEFIPVEIDLTAYKGQTIILQFRTDNPQGHSEGSAFVDNVEIHRLINCDRPTGLECTGTGENTATMSWTPGGSETHWLIQYSRDGILWSEEIDVDAIPFTLTELSPGTFYYVRVMAECSASETSASSNIATLMTQCGHMIIDDLPWFYNFDHGTETGSGKIPTCWRSVPYVHTAVFEEESATYPYVKRYARDDQGSDRDLAHSRKQHLKFYGGDATHQPCIILPYVDEDLHGLILNFWHREEDTDESRPHFTVGYLSDDNDVNSFVAVQSVERSETYTYSSVPLSSITADNVHHVAIRWDGGSSMWYGHIDDLELTPDVYIFDNKGNGNHRWDEPLNWNKHAVPNINHDVYIRAAAQVNEGTSGAVRSALIDRKSGLNSSIEIMPGGSLVIATTLEQRNDRIRHSVSAEFLTINSSAAGNGVLAVGEHDGTNCAQVNFYTKARHDASGWVNQFIGSPFNYDAAKDVFVDYYQSYLYQHNPETTDWDNVRRGTPPQPWVGYNLLRKKEDPDILPMRGSLVSSENHTYNLYYAEGHDENVIANSWTAPISISALNASGTFVSCEQTIYLFNAGSKQQNIEGGWSDEGVFQSNTASQNANSPGQFIAIPVNSSQWVTPTIRVIPPMQSFLVVATGAGAKLNVNYQTMVYEPARDQENAITTAATRAPQRLKDEDTKPDIIRVHVTGASGNSDRMHVLVREDFTPGFDDGYDGRKMFGAENAPQLYAITEVGEMSIHCIAGPEGTQVGFEPGEDSEYMITFTYDGMQTLYLNDLKEQTSTLISDESSYLFSTAEGDEISRFVISATPIGAPQTPTGIEPTSDSSLKGRAHKVIIDNQLYIFRAGKKYDARGARVE